MYMAGTPNDSDFIRVLRQPIAVVCTGWFTYVAWNPSVTYCIAVLCLAIFFATGYNIILRNSCVFYSGKTNIIIKMHYLNVLLPLRVKISVKIPNTTPLNEPNKNK